MTSLTCYLLFKDDLEHLSVCVEHQEMETAHGLTGAPVLDASGAVAWATVQMRIAVRFTAHDLLTVLSENRSAAGEPDSHKDLLMSCLTTYQAAFVLDREEVSVLEHP